MGVATEKTLLSTLKDKESNISVEESEKKVSTAKYLFALFICFTGVLCYCASFVSVQYLGGAVHENELNTWRFGVSALASLPFLCYEGKEHAVVPKRKWGLLFLTSLLSVGYNSAVYTSTVYIPVGTVAGISACSSLVSDVLIGLCKNRVCSIAKSIGALIAIAGILLVTQPRAIFYDVFPPPPKVNWTSPCLIEVFEEASLNVTTFAAPKHNVQTGYILSAVGGSLYTINFYAMQAFVCDTSAYALSFWKSFSSTIVSAILMLFLETPTFPLLPLCIFSLLSHAAGVTQYSIATAWCLKYLHPSTVNFIFALYIFILVISQYTLMKNILPGNHNWGEVVGSILCFIGCVSGIIVSTLKQRFGKGKTDS